MAMTYSNNLLDLVAQDRICTAFGVKIVPSAESVLIAKAAGYDTLFIDTEHTILTIRDVGQLCMAALSAGVTPFVRVPHQCGNGFIQRVLDAGAMGVIFPHIHTVDDAKRAIHICKYPPSGGRSITGGLPHFNFVGHSTSTIMPQMNQIGSTVFIMIETKDALENVDEIAALDGCDVLMVGSNDLTLEIGTAPDWDHPEFIKALEKVGDACKKHGKIFGIAGLYHRPDIMTKVVNEFGARWIVGGIDVGLLVAAAKQNCDGLKALKQ